MHKVAEGDLVEIAQLMVLSSCIDNLILTELNNAKTDPLENHQNNGAMPLVNTHLSLPHSTLEYALVASDTPLPRPHVEAENASLQARELVKAKRSGS